MEAAPPSLEAAPPSCSAAVYDNVCVFTALVVISLLAGASRRFTLVLPLGGPLKIPADSALKIFAFICDFEIPGFVLGLFYFQPEANPQKIKKQISICIPPPNQQRLFKIGHWREGVKKRSEILAK